MKNNRRGVAIETALVTLVFVFALCSLLTTLTLSVRKDVQRSTAAFEWRAEVDAIGDEFIRWMKNGSTSTAFTTTNTKYTATVEHTENPDQWTLTVTLGAESSAVTVLTVIVKKETDATVTIKQWKRSSYRSGYTSK